MNKIILPKPAKESAGPKFSTGGFRLALLALILVLGTFSTAGAANPEASAVIARVNGEPIYRIELARLTVVSGSQPPAGAETTPQAATAIDRSREDLRLLVKRQLLLQEASRKGLTVNETEIDQAITTLRRRFETIETFGAWMHNQGLDDKSLFDAVRIGMLTNRVLALLVDDVQISDEEIRRYFAEHKDQLEAGEEVRLRMILVRSEQEAEEILAALRLNGDFGRLARTRSLGLRAAQGGDTGWINVRALPPLLSEAVDRMQAGDVAGPLQKASDEYLLVGLQERRPLQMTHLAAARPVIASRLLAVRQQEVITAWFEDQEKSAEIEIILAPEQATTGREKVTP